MTEARFRSIERDRARQICTPGADVLRCGDRLLEIAAAARGLPVVFVLIPDEFQVEDGLWQQVGAASLDRDQAQRELVAWCAENGLRCIDLLPSLRAAVPWTDGNRHVYYARNTHWNRRGNEVAGAAIARYLEQELGFAAAPRERTVIPYGDGCDSSGAAPPVLQGRLEGDALVLAVRGGPALGRGLVAFGSSAGETDLQCGCRVRIVPLLPDTVALQCDAAGCGDVRVPLPASAPDPLFVQAGFLDRGARAASMADFLQAGAGVEVALSNALLVGDQ
jgi:hypothetical protein